MKYLITENQSLFLRRRLREIHKLVLQALKDVDPSDYTYHDYVEEIAWLVAEKYQGETDDDLNTVMDYVRDNYWKKIETHYLKYHYGFD